MAKKERMGSGLDMLFEDNFQENNGGDESSVQTLRISMIEPDKDQPRSNFDEEKLKELSDNIAQHGVLQPILVRPISDGSYRIVAGERRWRAARMAGLTELPVVIKEFSDIQAAQISLIENLQREDLDPIEEATAFKRLMEEFNMTQEMLAKSIGKSRTAISNSVRMLKLPEPIKQDIAEGYISPGHAKILCGIEDDNEFLVMATMAKSGSSVRELERALNEMRMTDDDDVKPVPIKRSKKEYVPDFSDPFNKYSMETALSFKELYGINAKVSKERQGGYSLKFSFDSEEDLRGLIDQLSKLL